MSESSSLNLSDMLKDLPAACELGTKKNNKGYKISWVGYKLHIDVADGGIPISAVLTSAAIHDSQVCYSLSCSRANSKSDDDDFGGLKIVTKALIAGILSELQGHLCPGFDKNDEIMESWVKNSDSRPTWFKKWLFGS